MTKKNVLLVEPGYPNKYPPSWLDEVCGLSRPVRLIRLTQPSTLLFSTRLICKSLGNFNLLRCHLCRKGIAHFFGTSRKFGIDNTAHQVSSCVHAA